MSSSSLTPLLYDRRQVRVTLVTILLALAVAAAAVTAWKIATLPDPTKAVLYRVVTESNADRRRNYLAAGGIVVVALLGAASIVAYSLRHSR